MTGERRGFLKDNTFLVAAVALPALVAAFFVLANAIPQWTVADPAYDLVLRAARPYEATPTRIAVEYAVRNGVVQATVRLAAENSYNQPWDLFIFDHQTNMVREIPVELPGDLVKDETRTIVVEELKSLRVSSTPAAPDGYQLTTRSGGGGGLVSDLFGMGRYRQSVGIENGGRVVPLELPAPYESAYSPLVTTVGWIVGPAQR